MDRDIPQRKVRLRLPGADDIQRRIYGRAAQITFFVSENSGCIAAQHAQKNGLQYILGVRRIPRKPVCRAKHQAVIGLEQSVELRRMRRNRSLSYGEFQSAPPVPFSALKTGGCDDYYKWHVFF